MVVRKQINFIYATVVCCSLSIVICGVSLGTDNWYSGVARSPSGEVVTRTDINYGLFTGSKSKQSKYVDLKIICAEGVCMYSCGLTADSRRADHRRLLSSGQIDDDICDETGTRAEVHPDKLRADGDTAKDRFFKFGFWLVTIVTLALGITFSAVGGALALYNTFRTPIQPILSIFGLYVWNGIAAASILLALILWGAAFGSSLRKNAAVSDTISQNKSSEDKGRLGYSYWILLLALFLNLLNIGLIRYRSWRIAKLEEHITQVIDEKITNGDTLLF